ncbi:MAG TPA: hypothetical protein VJN22_06680 [Candidatus Eremiobacteraceae bacterium]|nr:hypothetical protein [Candidatus Eremiobacteraceae bacterium]
MFKRVLLGLVTMTLLMPAALLADENPTYSGPMSASETQFVQSIQADLGKRFPHASDAEAAGYLRYTDPDNTGAISYANRQWTSQDIMHPSQLWYDKNGDLLGADFSVPNTDGKRPNLFGVNPGRWNEFDDHIHWVAKDPMTGKMEYDNWVMAPKWVAAGGDLKNPSADTLVKLGKVKAASSVTAIFDFPTVWDLIVWTKPNPNGAFAEKNPNVKP